MKLTLQQVSAFREELITLPRDMMGKAAVIIGYICCEDLALSFWNNTFSPSPRDIAALTAVAQHLTEKWSWHFISLTPAPAPITQLNKIMGYSTSSPRHA